MKVIYRSSVSSRAIFSPLFALFIACTGTNVGNPGGIIEPKCEKNVTEVSEDDSVTLGSAGASGLRFAEIVERIEGDYSAPLEWSEDSSEGRGGEVLVRVTAVGPLFLVEQDFEEPGQEDQFEGFDCSDFLRIAARVEFETADGQFNEVADADVELTPSSGTHGDKIFLSFEIDSRDLMGTFQPMEQEIPNDARNEQYLLSFSIDLTDGKLTGRINESHHYETSDGGVSGDASSGPLAIFGAED